MRILFRSSYGCGMWWSQQGNRGVGTRRRLRSHVRNAIDRTKIGLLTTSSVIIALLVYLVGGCVYQRTVMHARGWRQLPNYSMWAGIGSYIRVSFTRLPCRLRTDNYKDVFIILTSSCSRLIPRTSGYRSLSTTSGNGPTRRGNRSEDENRLIDQLDEEWED